MLLFRRIGGRRNFIGHGLLPVCNTVCNTVCNAFFVNSEQVVDPDNHRCDRSVIRNRRILVPRIREGLRDRVKCKCIYDWIWT